MNNKIISFLYTSSIFCLFLTGCEATREIDNDIFVFSGNRLVCYGDWGNDRPINISLFSNLPPLDTSSFKTVDNATVSLFVNGKFQEYLIFDEGVYRSPSNLVPLPGFEYNIEAEAEHYPSIISKRVTIPSEPQILEAELQMTNDEKQGEISIRLQDNKDEINFYTYKRNLYNGGEYIKTTSNSREENDIPVFMNIESDQLFNGNEFTVSMIFNTEILLFENFIPVDTIRVDSVKTVIYSTSTEYNDYFSSLPNGIEYGGFLPPETSVYTNIENGYGVIGTYVTKEVSFGL